MLAALLLPFASQAQETVTIGEGTSTTYVTPFNSLWGYSFVEQIYLASEIGTDGNITAVRFYLSSGTQTNNITLYMKNVTRSTFSSSTDYESVTASDIVFTGSVTFTAGWTEIQLTQPFEYDGSSNLMVAMHEYTSGYSTLYFNYTSATDRVISFHSDSANPDPYNLGSYSGNKYTSANRANIQLDIEPVGEVSCYAVKGLNVSDVSGHTVTLSWSDTSNSGATYDIYQIAPSADNDSIIDTTLLDNTSEYSYTITGLAPETSFRFGVAANCGADGPSNTRFVDATTSVACPVPTNVTYTLTSEYSTVDVAWVDHNASAWELRYWTGTDTSAIIQLEDTAYSIENLLPNTNYKFQVRAVCGDEDGSSQWTPASGRSFTTPLACRVPIQLTAVLDPTEPTSATITWVDTIASAWQVAFNGDTNDLIDVTETSITFDTLTPETTYTIMVRANCGDFVSPWTSVLSFEPTTKIVVGTAQNTSFYGMPIYPYYNYSLSEQIYTAAELGEAGAITSVDFIYRGTETRNIDVYMVNTSDSVFTNNFVPVTGSDLVFSGNVNFTANTWTTIQFDVPFIYNGASNVMLVVDDNTGSYSSSASGVSFVTFNTSSNQAIYDYQDDENYSTSNPQFGDYPNGGVTNKKNYVRFMKGEAPECFAVSNLTIVDSLTTSESITITWEDTINSNATYTVYLFGEEDTITDQATGMEYTFENLEATTGYTFGVTANCGDEETPMRTVSGRTDCEGGSCNITLVLHDSYGDGWNGNAISVVQAGESLGSYTISSGSAATHTVSVCSGAPVSFSWTSGSFASETSFEILDGGGLTAYSCTDGSTISGTFTTINDPCPSCLPVMDMTVDSISSESVTISWTSEAENFLFFLDGEEYEGSADGNTITIDELQPSTTYTFGVIVVCNADDSSSMATITFSTPCVAFTVDAETPFFEGFEGTDFAPNCWINEHISGPGSQLWQRNTSSSYVHEGSASAKLPDMNATTYTNLVTPNITINSQDDSYRVSFWMYRVSSTKPNEGVRVWANTLPTTDGGVELMHIRRGYGMGTITETAQGWYKYTAIIPDSLLESFYIVFEGISEYGNASYIDDITIDRAPSCVAATDFSITDSSLTAHAAAFEWESEGTSFQFEYKLHNDTTWTVVEVNEYSYELTGLEANTHYDARVKVLCDNDVSDYSSVIDFWTLIACPAPTNPRAILTPGDGTVATVVWTDTDGTAWQVCIPGEEDSTFIPVTDTTAYSFTGLTPETNYTVLVRRNCEDEEEGFSTWTSVTFQPTLKTVVGTPASTNSYLPTYSFYNYSLTQQIYTAAELGSTPGAIMSVDFMNGGSEKTRNLDVYMVSTTDSTISTFIPVTASDLVFSGSVTFTPNEWTTLVFNSPFIFDGSSNVILVVDDNTGSYSSGLSCYTFSAPSQAIRVYSDGTNYDPTAPSGYSGTVMNEKNYVRFLLGEPPTCLPVTSLTASSTENSVTLTWNDDINTAATYTVYNMADTSEVATGVTGTTYTVTGLSASTSYTFGVVANCSETDNSAMATVAATTSCGAVTVFPFEETFDVMPDCWTTIDADGDGYNWTVLSGYTAIQSASYQSGALTPDNWLITPPLTFPATGNYEVTWTATAQDQDWPAEHYGIFISTTGTDTSDFTMIQEWTLSTGVFNPVIDLSSYAGQTIYIALRHFNCTDMFRLSIDDFIVREQAGANQVVINVNQNNPAYGSVTGAGTYNIGDSVTVSATPASGYTFNRWVDEDNMTISSDNPYTFVATTNMTLKAMFLNSDATTYEVTVLVNDSTMGTATGSGTYAAGDFATLIATANPGYRFVNWTHTTSFGVTVFSTDDTTVVTVTSDKTYTANFELSAPADSFTVTLNTTAGGTVSPMGSTTVVDGDSFTATATADSGYHFVNWTNAAGAAVSTSNPYTFTVTQDVTLTAHFEVNGTQPTTYTVTVNYDATMGNVTGIPTGPVAAGSQVTLTANPLTGYHFLNWSTGDTTRTIILTVNGDINITANFEADQAAETYTVTVNYDATMGTVTGIPMAPVAAGTQVTLTATALPGYAFVNWSTGDTLATITITVNANIEITANFRSTIGIEDADMNSVSIFSANSTIYVKGAEGQNIYVYDLNGRTIATKVNATETMEIPMEQTGVYLVRVGNASAKRVIVMR